MSNPADPCYPLEPFKTRRHAKAAAYELAKVKGRRYRHYPCPHGLPHFHVRRADELAS